MISPSSPFSCYFSDRCWKKTQIYGGTIVAALALIAVIGGILFVLAQQHHLGQMNWMGDLVDPKIVQLELTLAGGIFLLSTAYVAYKIILFSYYNPNFGLSSPDSENSAQRPLATTDTPEQENFAQQIFEVTDIPQQVDQERQTRCAELKPGHYQVEQENFAQQIFEVTDIPQQVDQERQTRCAELKPGHYQVEQENFAQQIFEVTDIPQQVDQERQIRCAELKPGHYQVLQEVRLADGIFAWPLAVHPSDQDSKILWFKTPRYRQKAIQTYSYTLFDQYLLNISITDSHPHFVLKTLLNNEYWPFETTYPYLLQVVAYCQNDRLQHAYFSDTKQRETFIKTLGPQMIDAEKHFSGTENFTSNEVYALVSKAVGTFHQTVNLPQQEQTFTRANFPMEKRKDLVIYALKVQGPQGIDSLYFKTHYARHEYIEKHLKNYRDTTPAPNLSVA
jgi:hypothetical protein